jgi:hypothetical protein
MARKFPRIEAALATFIGRQRIFFTATAAPGARINISPREGAALRVLSPNAVCYLDQTGSGAETAAHARADGRMTIMLCAFEGPPMILRLYGTGQSILRGSSEYAAMLAEHYAGEETPGARQIVHLAVDLVQISCGYGVPLFDHVGDRATLRDWAARQGEDGLRDYRAEKNAVSLDGLPTGLA